MRPQDLFAVASYSVAMRVLQNFTSDRKEVLAAIAQFDDSNLGSMEQFLEVPVFPEKGLAGSSIVLAEQTSRLPELIQSLQTRLLEESNTLLYSGMQIEPRGE